LTNQFLYSNFYTEAKKFVNVLIFMKKIIGNKKIILSYVFFQLFIFHVVQFIIGPLIPLISRDLGVSLETIGITVSLSVLGLFLSAFLSGSIIERFGYRPALNISLIFSFIGCLGVYFSLNHISFILFYLILQISAGIIIGCTISLTGYISGRNRGTNLVGVMIGAAMANLISPLIISLTLLKGLNWRSLFLFLVVPLLALSVLFIFLKIPETAKKFISIKQIFRSNKRILSNGSMIIYSLLIFFNVAVIYTFYTWFTLYFSTMETNIIKSSFYLSFFGLALVLGGVLKIQILKILNEINILLITLFASLVFMGAIYYSNNLYFMILFVFLFGLSISSNGMLIISLGLKVYKKYDKTISGNLLAASYLGVICFQYLVGYFSEHYTSNSVIYINMVILFISLVIVIYIKFFKMKIIKTFSERY